MSTWSCPYCNGLVSSKKWLEEHIRSRCPKAPQRATRAKHSQAKHRLRIRRCPICGRKVRVSGNNKYDHPGKTLHVCPVLSERPKWEVSGGGFETNRRRH